MVAATASMSFKNSRRPSGRCTSYFVTARSEQKLEIRLRPGQTSDVRLAALAADERVGIRPFGQQRDVHLKPLSDEHLRRPCGRTLPGGIRIETEDDLGRETFQNPGLRAGERRTARGHYRLDSRLPHLRQVEIPLDQHTIIVLPDGPFRHVQTVERPALGVERGFGRIQVFGHLPLVEGPASKRHNCARIPGNWNHQAIPEPVDQHALLALDDEPALDLQGNRDLPVRKQGSQCIATGRRCIPITERPDVSAVRPRDSSSRRARAPAGEASCSL
jgi:hypothetical protein